MAPQAIETMTNAPAASVSPLPDRYAKFKKPRQLPPPGRLRLFLQGKVGSGKTTFVCGCPRAAILDFENKATAVRNVGPGSEIFHLSSASEYLALIDQLVQDGAKGQRVFDTVVFDTALTFREVMRDELTKTYREHKLLRGLGDITDYKSEGAGWAVLNSAVCKAIEQIYWVGGYGWIATAHVTPKWRESGKTSVCSWESVLNAGILDYLHSQCEFCGFFQKDTQTFQKPGPPRKVAGRVLPGPVLKTTETVYQLCFVPPDPKLAVREHIPVKQQIMLPEQAGYAAFESEYQRASSVWLDARNQNAPST